MLLSCGKQSNTLTNQMVSNTSLTILIVDQGPSWIVNKVRATIEATENFMIFDFWRVKFVDLKGG